MNNVTKKFLQIAASGLMAVSITACKSSGGSTSAAATASASALDPTTGRYPRIVEALATDPQNMEPKDPIGSGHSGILWQVYETLFDIDDNGAYVSSIGKDLKIVDDKTYDVTIYDCVKDSAGNPITAADVVYSVNWLYNSGNAIKYDLFDSVEAVDDYTVRFHWKSAPSTLSDLEFPLTRTFIFSQKSFESHTFATDPIGTGPYTLKEFVSGSKVVIEANDNYWALADKTIMANHMGLHQANVQEIEYDVITESAQAAIALQQKQVDYCDYISTAASAAFTEGGQFADQFNVNTQIGGDFYVLVPNVSSLTDVNLREAIFYALDNTAISKVMGGNYAPLKAIGTAFFSDYPTAWEDQTNYITEYNLDKAKEYLAKSNYSGQTIRILSMTDEASKNAATMINTMLTAAGITSEIDAKEGLLYNTVASDKTAWDIEIAGVGGNSLAGAYNRLYSNTVYSGYSLGFIQDDQLQSLYTAANTEATHDEQHMSALNDYVIQNAYMYPLAVTSSSRIYTKAITQLYFREKNVPVLSCSTYAGQTANYPTPTPVISSIAPSADAGYKFTDSDGTVWVLNVAADNSWTLTVGSTTYTGDMSFPGKDANVLTTTPPKEGTPDAAFYNADGTCDWYLIDASNMVPVKYADYDSYVASHKS
jgi:peptide/nickel transport system substrate-binding protein